MTDIDELRARMREAAEKATPGPWKTHPVDDTTVIGPDGVDVCTTCDSSQAEREDGYNVEYERMEADAAFIAAANPHVVIALLDRAEAAEAALAKRDEEVARLRETMRAASVYLRKLEDNMLANDADMMLDDCLPPSFHADQIDQALTKEPPHAG